MLSIFGGSRLSTGLSQDLSVHRNRLARGLERLSTGTRILSGKDDAAGLATANRIQAQVRGNTQAVRNLSEGLSMLRVTEDTLTEVMGGLQRARELLIQANNDTVTSTDRISLQQEFDALVEEMDRVIETTTFNGRQVITPPPVSLPAASADEIDLATNMRNSWLEQSEARISTYYNLSGDNVDLSVELTTIDGSFNTLARVSGSAPLPAGVPATGLTMQVDSVDYVDPAVLAQIGDWDRIVAHEMVHVLQYRNINILTTQDSSVAWGGTTTGTWFIEGTAELMIGADERLNQLYAAGPGQKTPTQLRDRVVELISGSGWGAGGAHGFSTAEDYAAAYVAARYLHERIVTAGGNGMSDVFDYMKSPANIDGGTGAYAGVEQAVRNIASGAYSDGLNGGAGSFAADFSANGLTYINAIDNADLTDVGAIGGSDVSGGAALNSAAVIDDTVNNQIQPLDNFNVVWQAGIDQVITSASQDVDIQVGANPSDRVTVAATGVTIESLGLDTIDFGASDLSTSIDDLDTAISDVNAAQASLGANMNRLEAALSVGQGLTVSLGAALGQKRDADFMAETARFARADVLSSASLAMLGQAQSVSNALILTLLGQ